MCDGGTTQYFWEKIVFYEDVAQRNIFQKNIMVCDSKIA